LSQKAQVIGNTFRDGGLGLLESDAGVVRGNVFIRAGIGISASDAVNILHNVMTGGEGIRIEDRLGNPGPRQSRPGHTVNVSE
jgi:hypothetical protein